MPSIIHLNTIWEHTLTEILNHYNKTEVGILEDMSDLLIYDLRLSPAEPHFPILFPILVQSDRFIFF